VRTQTGMVMDNTKHQWDLSAEPNQNGNYDLIVQHEPFFEIISLKDGVLEVKRYKAGKNSGIEYYKKQCK